MLKLVAAVKHRSQKAKKKTRQEGCNEVSRMIIRAHFVTVEPFNNQCVTRSVDQNVIHTYASIPRWKNR